MNALIRRPSYPQPHAESANIVSGIHLHDIMNDWAPPNVTNGFGRPCKASLGRPLSPPTIVSEIHLRPD